MGQKDIDKQHKSNTIVYTIYHKQFSKEIRWSQLKSRRLKRTRGVSFKEIIKAKLLDIRDHPKRSDQQVLIYDYKGYVWAVPFVIDEKSIFLKTLYPSRKYHKLYKER